MSYAFQTKPAAGGAELRLLGPGGAIPYDSWEMVAPADGLAVLWMLSSADGAMAEGDFALLDDTAVARLSPSQATAIGCPATTSAIAHLAFTGIVTMPTFGVRIEWRDRLSKPIAGAMRLGAFLKRGDRFERLPEPIFRIAEAADIIVSSNDDGMRKRALATITEMRSAAGEMLATSGIAETIEVVVASAFSLSVDGTGNEIAPVPVLHAHGSSEATPLLDEASNDAFRRAFVSAGRAQAAYTLPGAAGRRVFVVLEPAVQSALEVVRRIRDATMRTRREFLAEPRRFLRDALGEEEEALIESIFAETEAYSERVRGLGLWERRSVPNFGGSKIDWFGPEAGGKATGGQMPPTAGSPGPDDGSGEGHETGGSIAEPTPSDEGPVELLVLSTDGDGRRRIARVLQMPHNDMRTLCHQIEAAMAAGEPFVPWKQASETIAISADYGNFERLRSILDPPPETPSDTIRPEPTSPYEQKVDAASRERLALLIHSNEDALEHEAAFRKRPASDVDTALLLRSVLKSHQVDGLAWLRQAWARGNPGVLLADDMGLGKTFQILAFLACVRAGMRDKVIHRQPILIVAPTGLLENWRAEHDRHLTGEGLGGLVRAYGADLAAIKRKDADGVRRIDASALRSADWVLTTYATMRDHDTDFGKVMFSVAVFDESQTVKNPGARVTDAAKAMNAQFKVAMTGTPIENSLRDLWCVVDLAHDGGLGSLKDFARNYGSETSPDRLIKLKAHLVNGRRGAAPTMLRRLKREHLPDLPQMREQVRTVEMPRAQRAAYDAALPKPKEITDAANRSRALQVLQALAAVSLHPDLDNTAEETNDETYIARSARLIGLVAELDDSYREGRKALIFVDRRLVQERLAGILQRRYKLVRKPAVISGAVDGMKRQALVDAFQAAPPGFGAMILSPKAGGVGLTLTAATRVIHLSRWWNPAVEDQCNGRALRIGQTQTVDVTVIQAIHPSRRSFDENLNQLLVRKRRLMEETLEAPEPSDGDIVDLYQKTISY